MLCKMYYSYDLHIVFQTKQVQLVQYLCTKILKLAEIFLKNLGQ